jgi:hypothetical protein
MTSTDSKPTPDTSLHGPVLSLGFPGMRIGVAEYAEGPTGTTVFHFPELAKAAVDERGGFPGTFNVDMLRMGYDTQVLDAVVISGGSIYGLEAARWVSSSTVRVWSRPIDCPRFSRHGVGPSGVSGRGKLTTNSSVVAQQTL